MRSILLQNRPIVRVALATALLLLVPWIAMRFSDQMTWDETDFIAAGLLLFGAGLTYELVARRGGAVAYKAGVAVAVLTGLLLVWMNLAVGLIGSEDNPANLMYLGVLAIGMALAFAGRLEPRGMARALFATAAAQMLVAVIAQIAGEGFTYILNGVFALLWVGAALLFRHAGESNEAAAAD